jgi:hypothetical protein
MSRMLITFGFILIVLGVLWPILKKFDIGHLPGDMIFKRGSFTFYFPITTCIVISLVFTVITWWLKR